MNEKHIDEGLAIMQEHMNQLKEHEKEAWKIASYYQLVRILKEANQLATELSEHLEQISLRHSSLKPTPNYISSKMEAVTEEVNQRLGKIHSRRAD